MGVNALTVRKRLMLLAAVALIATGARGQNTADLKLPVLTVSAPESLQMYGPLVAAVLRDAGIKPELNFYPTARSRKLFASGSVDAEFFRIAKLPPDYPADTIAIGPLQSVRFGMFVRANDPQPVRKPVDWLWQQPMAYVRGTLAVEALLKSRSVLNAVEVGRASAVNMLLAGRVDVVIDSERLMLQKLKESNASDAALLAHTVLEEPTYLLLNGRARALEPAIRRAVRDWMESGRWQREYQAINKLNDLPPDMSLVKYPGR